MSARRNVTVTDWLTWVESEALTSGWLSVRPYEKPNNRAGAPDVLLARGGNIVGLWVRPGGDSLTKAQAEWAVEMLGDDHPTPGQPIRGWQATEGPERSVQAILSHAVRSERELLRKVLA